MFFIQQANEHDCGFTCLKILLANIHHDSNYLFLTNPFKEGNVSFLELIKEGSKYQTDLQPLKTENKMELSNYDNFPIIARVNINNVSHALYVYKVSKKYVYYYDPSKGKKKVSLDDFSFLWTGEFIALKSFTKHPCPVTKPKFMKLSESITSLIISFITAVSSVLAVFFINKESYIFLPLIFFTVMILSEIILKKYSMVIMKRIDKRVEEFLGEVKNKDYYGFYKTYEGYKKYLLINHLSTFSHFYIFLIIALVFIINDKLNFIYIVMNLLLAVSYSVTIKPMLNADEVGILEAEDALSKTKDKLVAYSYMNSAREKAYKYADKEVAFKYVVIAIQVILTFILMMYLKLVSVTYILCYTFLQIYLYNNVVSLLTSNEDYSKQDNLLNKMLDMIENKNSQ